MHTRTFSSNLQSLRELEEMGGRGGGESSGDVVSEAHAKN